MISLQTELDLTATERSQLQRREYAIGSWRQGQPENGLIILSDVISEGMTSRVAGPVYVTQACCYAELGQWDKSLKSLNLAGQFIDESDLKSQSGFFHQRARAHAITGKLNAALTDYAGAAACAEMSGDLEYVAIAANNVAGIYLTLNKLDDAHESIDKAIKIASTCHSNYLSQAYDTLANVLLAEGRLEAAIDATEEAFALAGENEVWLQTFQATRGKIDGKLRELLGIRSVKDMQVYMVRQALIETGGSMAAAGAKIGLTHKGVSYIVDNNKELEQFRSKRRVRHKPLITKSQ